MAVIKVISVSSLLRGAYNSDFVGIKIDVSKASKLENGFPKGIIYQLDKASTQYAELVAAGFDAYGEQKLYDMSSRNGWPYEAFIDTADCRRAGGSVIVSRITFKDRKKK